MWPYARRVEVTNAITKNIREAKDLVKRYDKFHSDGVLFGPEFQKKIQEEKEESRHGLLALGKQGKDYRHGKHRHDKRPFREEPVRSERPDLGGYRGGSRGRQSRGQGCGHSRGGSTSQKRYVQLSSSLQKSESIKSNPLSIRKSNDESESNCDAQGLSILLVRNRPSPPRNNKAKLVSSNNKAGEDWGSGKGSSSKLGKNHSRQNYFEHGSGLHYPFHRRATQEPQGISANFSSQERKLISSEIEKMEQKGAIIGGIPIPPPISGSHLPETKEGRIAKADLQSQATKSLRPVPTFQNGGTGASEKPVATRGLDDKVGPQGRLLLCANEGLPKEAPAIQMGCEAVRVSVPAIRLSLSPERLHKAHETSSRSPAQDRDQSHNLPRRPAPDEPVPRTPTEGWQDNRPPAGEPGICDQHSEIAHNAISGSRIPGHDDQFSSNDDEAVRGEDKQDPQSVSNAAATRESVSAGSVETDRHVVVHRLGSAPSEALSKRVTEVENSGTEQETIVRDPDHTYSRVQRGAEVVDKPPTGSEWKGNESTSTRYDNRQRCVSHRLGGNHQWSDAEGPLDCRGEERTDQHPRTASSPPHSQIPAEGKIQHPRSLQSGQHDSSLPHQQDGWNTLSSTDRNCERDLGILLQEEDTSLCRIPTREYECPSRPIVAGIAGLE